MKNIIIIFIPVVIFISCKEEEIVSKQAEDYNLNRHQILRLINDVRLEGCTCGSENMAPAEPLRWNDNLARAALSHSKDMNANNHFNHIGTDGTSFTDRMLQQGYAFQTGGENIAFGYGTEEEVVNGWLDSPGHCRNIMNPSYTEMGVARDGNYWTQVFGTPQPQ